MEKRWLNKDIIFKQVDDDYYLEDDFEMMVQRNLNNLFYSKNNSNLIVKQFKKKFYSKTNNQGVMADLIAFDSNYKAWWVIEVELIGHSFDRHVFPQMEKLIDIDYRDYEEVITDAVSKEYKELDKSKFGELIKRRTHQVITVANKFYSHWSGELRALGVDLIGMQPYQSEGSKNSFEGSMGIGLGGAGGVFEGPISDNITFLSGVFEFAQKGIIPGGSKRNLEYINDKIQFHNNIADFQKLMLADAQTSGGLLISCPGDRAEEFLKVLSWDMQAFRVGEIIEKNEKLISVK